MSQIQKLYLSEAEASNRYGYSRQWFQRQRWLGTGPKFIKVNGGRIFYPIEITDHWFASFGLQSSTSETRKAQDE
jgi:hypothetical protein